jgi:cobalt-zinc-cadmium efflux system membrane fusion protein
MKVNAWTAVVGLSVVFAAGASTTYVLTRHTPPASSLAISPTGHAAAPGAASRPVEDVITMTPELMERAGIVTEVAGASGAGSQLRVPGTVQPNAYRKVSVTPLVGGRVNSVLVTLGQAVTRGAVLAEIYSPEVARARASYVAARADVEVGEAKLRRTERLVALGSASQQELDEVRAEHVRHETELNEGAARLRLFGLDPARTVEADPQAEAAASVIRVRAPQSGVVIERPATAGMTVEPATSLVTIADLSPVWVIADLYERDLGRVAIGAPAAIASEAYPGLQLSGRVTYLSPDVRPETRTAQVRVELPNPDGKLRFGMYVTVMFGESANAAVAVPISAVQTIGPDSVVFVREGSAESAFKERRVTIGQANNDRVAILTGLAPGERVVTHGSFTLRAEAERLGIRPSEAHPQSAATPSQIQTLSVEVTEKGFNVSAPAVKAGVPVRMTFIRKTDTTCATDVALPEYGIRRHLPLNTPVTVEFTPRTDVTFQCGMGMLSGTLTVR